MKSLSNYDLRGNKQKSELKKFQWSTGYYNIYNSLKSFQLNQEDGIKAEADFIYLSYTEARDKIDTVNFTSEWCNNCKPKLQGGYSLYAIEIDSVSKETQPAELSNAAKPLLPIYQDGDNLRLVIKSPDNDSLPFSRNGFTKNEK